MLRREKVLHAEFEKKIPQWWRAVLAGLSALLLTDNQSVAVADAVDTTCWGLSCEVSHSLEVPREIIARELHLADLDTNQDGILNGDAELLSGDIIFRPDDGVTLVEEKHYIVPSNRVLVDQDGNHAIESNEVVLARIVVVTQDNLTYVFYPESSRVQAVFPNGTGRAGANTITSVRRINVELGPEWGQAESEREHLIPYPDGTIPNYFGDRTLGTRFYIHADAETDIDTQQELHGTFRAHAGSVDGENLLGTEISGGCTRHSNFAARYMSDVVSVGEVVITMETPEDDSVDNPLTIYNRTLLAAGLEQIMLSQEVVSFELPSLLKRPRNEVMQKRELGSVTRPTWQSFSEIGFPTTFTPVEHPFYRGEYTVIPCGSETLWITSLVTGRQLLQEASGSYSLVLPETITLPDGSRLNVAAFYQPLLVTVADVETHSSRLSAGDPQIGIFEYLFSDLAYQYAEYVVAQQTGGVLSDGEMVAAIATMGESRLRQIQLVTGVIPVRYFTGTSGPDGVIGDRLGIVTNRTMIQHAMNLFYGESAPTYELDPRRPANSNAFLLTDMEIAAPAMDNEVVRVTGDGISAENLIRAGLEQNRPMVLRISYYRYLADASYVAGFPAGHYFAVIPEYSDVDAGYIGVYDTMHPYQVIQVPLDQVDELFTTVTIGQ